MLTMSRRLIQQWFERNNGRVRKQRERPLLTEDKKAQRVQWCLERQAEMSSGRPVYYAFLDEKWFYIRSRRKKVKILPEKYVHEPLGAAVLPARREVS
jgi:hypothetical protein